MFDRRYSIPEEVLAFSQVGVVVALLGITGWHASLYDRAGVDDIHFVGALVIQLLIVGGMVLLTAAQWRQPGSWPARVVVLAAGVASLIVGGAVLPHVAAGTGWLTTLLGITVTLAVNALIWVDLAFLATLLEENAGKDPGLGGPVP